MAVRRPPELDEGLSLLDRYTVVDRIATGGMADIYRAHDSRLDRIVCVKLLRNVIEGSGTDGGVLYQATYEHFLREARALSKLAHPNTLRIYDFGFLQIGEESTGEIAPRPFQISEYLDGGNLETYVRARGALKPIEVLAIVDRIASAIGEAHGAGIIHRDIKPSNILFSRVGDVLMPKLADFGIARAVMVRARPSQAKVAAATASGEAAAPTTHDPAGADPGPTVPVPLFTPRWAAPEQLASSEEGPYTDVYALGLVVAFMLAGQGLFEDVASIEDTFDERVKGDTLVRSRLAAHMFAPEVARVLMDALRADRRLRTPSPFAFYEALSHAVGTPRASLPTTVAHSGGVPTAPSRRPSYESITVRAESKTAGDPRSIEPPEHWIEIAGRHVRIVETHEKLEVSFSTEGGAEVRLRATLLPARGTTFSVNFKGLNCFVGWEGKGKDSSPSPAIVADVDGAAELISTRKERLGGLSWSFGTIRGASRVFPIADGELVIPFPQGEHAVAIELAPQREVIVICRRA